MPRWPPNTAASTLQQREEGLQLFAEHTESARAHPGSHPNIDRLQNIIASGQALAVKLVMA
jgi:hypothetical protein